MKENGAIRIRGMVFLVILNKAALLAVWLRLLQRGVSGKVRIGVYWEGKLPTLISWQLSAAWHAVTIHIRSVSRLVIDILKGR